VTPAGGTAGSRQWFYIRRHPTRSVSEIEVDLPDRVDNGIDRLVEQGEFISRDQAVEELLSMGLSAYDVTGSTGAVDEPDTEWVTQAVSEQQDPALRDVDDDEPF